jgi:ribosomal 50S subunit-associated protein YjgA (DUF615 family)
MNTFETHLSQISLQEKLQAAEIFASMFHPPHDYSKETGLFFYREDQAAFNAFVVGLHTNKSDSKQVLQELENIKSLIVENGWKALTAANPDSQIFLATKSKPEPSDFVDPPALC